MKKPAKPAKLDRSKRFWLIPLMLLVCAVVVWLFAGCVTRQSGTETRALRADIAGAREDAAGIGRNSSRSSGKSSVILQWIEENP